MPRRPVPRELGSEQRLVEAIRRLRTQRGMTYAELAQRMTAAGCPMYASGVQKTLEAGRRVTVDELIGYARAFDTTPESLLQYGGERQPRTEEMWRDLVAATHLQTILRTVRLHYDDAIRGVQNEARHNAELRQLITDRLDQYTRLAERDAGEQAERDREDVSTPQLLTAYMKSWGFYDYPVLVACRDALRRQRTPAQRRGTQQATEPGDPEGLPADVTAGLDPASPTYADDVLARIRESRETKS